jgi:hypothetical protein
MGTESGNSFNNEDSAIPRADINQCLKNEVTGHKLHGGNMENNKHLFMLSYVIILGELFFFTVEGIKTNDQMINSLINDLYKNITFN